MPGRPVVLIHGYSDRGESFAAWRNALIERGHIVEDIFIASYASKTNEVTIPDIGEALDRALRYQLEIEPNSAGKFEEFDVVVHSTGMLVLREWMMRDPGRLSRVKHIIGLAPATWGSPLAQKGRSLLGAVFKGERELGPDFMEAGDKILIGLELASDYTWKLAERDLIGPDAVFGQTDATPWAFVFVGDRGYGGLRRLVAAPGTDGTVRWAGVGMNSRKITIDLTQDPKGNRVVAQDWHNVDVPLVFVHERNHGSILKDPPSELVDMVSAALGVEDMDGYQQWKDKHEWREDRPGEMGDKLWQQFVIRAVDERGDPVPDWYLELCTVDSDGKYHRLDGFDLDVHTFEADPSYRCFHVKLNDLEKHGEAFGIRVAARSGTELVAYFGVDSQNFRADRHGVAVEVDDTPQHKWDAEYNIGTTTAQTTSGQEELRLLAPFTTTMIELQFNREPMPPEGVNKVLWFLDREQAGDG